MNARNALTLLVLAAIAFTSACSGGGGDHKTNFQGFVQNLATTPTDNTDPVAIDGTNFNISEDPHQFDTLFQ